MANIVNDWRTEIVGGLDANGAIKRKNEEWLRKEAKGKQKCEKIMRETFGKKNYITKTQVGEVRNIFKARVGMSEFADNSSKDKRFMRTN